MPHSQHGKSTTNKQRHRRSDSYVSKKSKRKQEQTKQSEKRVVEPSKLDADPAVQTQAQQQPGPWSPWIPNEDGRWFYQGRLKPDGTAGWEYQFTEGYPPSPRRRLAAFTADIQPIPHEAPIAVPSVPNSGIAVNQLPSAGIGQADEEDEEDENGEDDSPTHETDVDTRTPAQILNSVPVQHSQAVVAVNTPPPAAARSGNDNRARQVVVKYNSGKGNSKKLSAIVKADKDRRLSSRKRIKGWLSGVTP